MNAEARTATVISWRCIFGIHNLPGHGGGGRPQQRHPIYRVLYTTHTYDAAHTCVVSKEGSERGCRRKVLCTGSAWPADLIVADPACSRCFSASFLSPPAAGGRERERERERQTDREGQRDLDPAINGKWVQDCSFGQVLPLPDESTTHLNGRILAYLLEPSTNHCRVLCPSS